MKRSVLFMWIAVAACLSFATAACQNPASGGGGNGTEHSDPDPEDPPAPEDLDPETPPAQSVSLALKIGEVEYQNGDTIVFNNREADFSSHTQTLTIANKGSGALSVSSAATSGDCFSVSANPVPAEAPLILAPGETAALKVKFAPTDVKKYSGKLTIASSDSSAPTAQYFLVGQGSEDSVDLVLREDESEYTPWEEVDFGTVWTGRTETKTFRLMNIGYSSTNIASLEFDPGDSDLSFDADFSDAQALWNQGAIDIAVTFGPRSFGSHEATITATYGSGQVATFRLSAEGDWFPVKKLAFTGSGSSKSAACGGKLLVVDSASRLLVYNGSSFADSGYTAMQNPVAYRDGVAFGSKGKLVYYDGSSFTVLHADSSGYYDFGSPVVVGDSIYFLDDWLGSGGSGSQYLYLWNGTTAARVGAGSCRFLAGPLNSTVFVEYGAGGAAAVTGTTVTVLTKSSGCDYSTGMFDGLAIGGRFYFVDEESTSSADKHLYSTDGSTIENAAALRNAGLANNIAFLGILDGRMYLAGGPNSASASLVSFDGTAAQAYSTPGGGAVWPNKNFPLVRFDGGIVFSGYGATASYPSGALYLKNGVVSYLTSDPELVKEATDLVAMTDSRGTERLYFARPNHDAVEVSSSAGSMVVSGLYHPAGDSLEFNKPQVIGDTVYFFNNSSNLYEFQYDYSLEPNP